jgi:hypothetical protein
MFTFTPGITMTAGMTFTPVLPPPTVLESLVVAGGGPGGGGGYNGGGGGAGGLIYNSGLPITTNVSYTVTVGAGGTGVTTQGTNGLTSTLFFNNSYGFNGTAKYLSIANNAAFDFGTSDCTFEAWVYIQSYSTLQQIVYSQSLTSGSNGYQFMVLSSGFLQMESQASTVDQAITATNNAIPLNTWTHVAFTRASGTNRLFVNGNLCTTTGTLSQAISTGGYPVYIGAYLYSSIANIYFNGNISNVRLVKGVAVYTGNFTVPTSPLAATQSAGTNISAITGAQTSLLLGGTFLTDNSTYAFTITNTGSVAFSNTSPFGITTNGGGAGGSHPALPQTGLAGGSGGGGSQAGGAGGAGTSGQGNAGGGLIYAAGGGGGGAGAAVLTPGMTAGPYTYGTAPVTGGVGSASTIIPNYSISFNGTSQYLTYNPGSTVAFGTGDFTVEVWAYATSALTSGDNPYICDTRGGGGVWNFSWNWNGGANPWQLAWGNSTALQSTTSMTINTWNHCVYVRSGTTGTLYLNGVSIGTWTDSTNYSASVTSMTIARRYVTSGGVQYFPGYLSNLRIVKGTALYTSNFPVPTPPLRAITNTSLLTAQSSTIVDNSTNAFTMTAIGSPVVSSSVIPTAYYAGGGGGGGRATLSVPQGPGGLGGGGAGGAATGTNAGTAGATNTGGGGGGIGSNSEGGVAAGGSGGSGIAIIRYQSIYAQATTTTGSPTFTSTDGYNIYTWTSSGSFIFTFVTPTVEYLVVAGGGSAGAGGAGAGGFRTASEFAVASGTPITVTVGAGGPAQSAQALGINGSDSVFSTITSTGGGGGSSNGDTGASKIGNLGGSGGGGANNGAGGAGTAGQGFAGGAGYTDAVSYGLGGGGGGAAAVGQTVNAAYNATGGNGGAGLSSSISGTLTYYAGGGGGGGHTAGPRPGGTGGVGGGGNGSISATASSGTVNTGGGAGGAGYGYTGGSGGSGIVIIRYASTYPLAASTTGSPTVAIAGGYNVYIWTSSGSITF